MCEAIRKTLLETYKKFYTLRLSMVVYYNPSIQKADGIEGYFKFETRLVCEVISRSSRLLYNQALSENQKKKTTKHRKLH